MEKGAGNSAALDALISSPRSPLSWKDVWPCEIAETPEHLRSNSSPAELASVDQPRTLETSLPQPKKLCRSLSGPPSPFCCTDGSAVVPVADQLYHSLPSTPKQRSTSPFSTLAWADVSGNDDGALEPSSSPNTVQEGQSSADAEAPQTPPVLSERPIRRSLLFHPSPNDSSPEAVPDSTADHLCRNSSRTETREFQLAGDEALGTQVCEELQPKHTTSGDRMTSPRNLPNPSSKRDLPACEDEISVDKTGEDMWGIVSPASTPADGVLGARPKDRRVHFIASLSEELLSLNSCAKRAVDLGRKVQHYASVEVSQLRGERAKAEATAKKFVKLNQKLEQEGSQLRWEIAKAEVTAQKFVKLNHDLGQEVSNLRGQWSKAEATTQKLLELNHGLEQQVFALRDQQQKLQQEWEQQLLVLRDQQQKLQQERELEVLAMRKESQQLVTERDTLLISLSEEKNHRERVQRELDSALSVISEERERAATEREANEIALGNERRRVENTQKERHLAMVTLQDGTRKLDAERDAMLDALRDLTAKLDMERDAKLRSMRRSSMDICLANMISGMRSGGDRRKPIKVNDESPYAWKNSRQ